MGPDETLRLDRLLSGSGDRARGLGKTMQQDLVTPALLSGEGLFSWYRSGGSSDLWQSKRNYRNSLAAKLSHSKRELLGLIERPCQWLVLQDEPRTP